MGGTGIGVGVMTGGVGACGAGVATGRVDAEVVATTFGVGFVTDAMRVPYERAAPRALALVVDTFVTWGRIVAYGVGR